MEPEARAQPGLGPPSLVRLSLEAAAAHDFWTVQRRTVERLPPDLANPLLAALLRRGAFDGAPHLLDRFAACATRVEVDARGCELTVSPAQLIAWLSSFRYLESLAIENSKWLRDAHLAPLAARAPTLRALSLRGCASAGAPRGGAAAAGGGGAAAAIAALTGLRSLDLSYTGFRPQQLRLSQLAAPLSLLTSLSLAGLQLDDAACDGIKFMIQLRALDLTDAVVTHAFVEGALGALTGLTRLSLGWCTAGCLPVLGSLRELILDHCDLADVAHSGHGGEMRLERLSAAACRVTGVAALALPEILRASAPTLVELDLADCHTPEPHVHGGSHPLWLLPALAGTTKLRRLDLSSLNHARRGGPSGGGAAAGDGAPPPLADLPPLMSLGMSNLTELALRGAQPRGPALGELLQGLAALRRLDVSGGAPGGAARIDVSKGSFDDDGVAAIAECGLPALEELDASSTWVEGRFSGAAHGDAADAAAAEAAAAAVWRRVGPLRILRLGNTSVTSKAAVAGLAAGLGGSLERLSLDGLRAPALAALCRHARALRELRVGMGGLGAADLEKYLPRLPKFEYLELQWQNPLIVSAEQLRPLAARLRRGTIVVDGADVGAAAREEQRAVQQQAAAAAAASPVGAAKQQQALRSSSPGEAAGSSGGGGGGSAKARRSLPGADAARRAGDLSAFDERLRYSRQQLEALRLGPGVPAAAAGVRLALHGPGGDGDDGGAVAYLGILASDW